MSILYRLLQVLFLVINVEAVDQGTAVIGSAVSLNPVDVRLKSISCLKLDQFNDGNLLICTPGALIRFPIEQPDFTPIAGSLTSSHVKYKEGVGRLARFGLLADLIQINETSIAVSDKTNFCIRSISTGTSKTDPLAGICEEPGKKDGVFHKATFRGPHGMMKKDRIIYVCDEAGQSIRLLDLDHSRVTTLPGVGPFGESMGASSSMFFPTHISCFQPACSEIYLTLQHGVAQIDEEDDSITMIAGGQEQSRSVGALEQTTFSSPAQLMLISERYMLVADSNNSRIVLIDLVTEQSNDVVQGHFFPRDMVTYGEFLYIGTDTGILYGLDSRELPEKMHKIIYRPISKPTIHPGNIGQETIIGLSAGIPSAVTIILVAIGVTIWWKRNKQTTERSDPQMSPDNLHNENNNRTPSQDGTIEQTETPTERHAPDSSQVSPPNINQAVIHEPLRHYNQTHHEIRGDEEGIENNRNSGDRPLSGGGSDFDVLEADEVRET